MVDHHPVQTSAVYLLGAAARPTVPPPSPPSPLTPSATVPGTPIDELCLNDAEGAGSLGAETARAKERIAGAIHVLDTEATALRGLATLYEEDAAIAAPATRGFRSPAIASGMAAVL